MTTEEKRKRALIAEDDSVSSHLLETFLAKWGYQVISVPDGLEALRILEGPDAPRLAIVDWMMPGLEGPQVCKRLRARRDLPYVYFILLTARTEKTDRIEGLELGVDDYLTKPFDSQELHGRVQVGQRILELQENLLKARAELLFRATHDLLTGISNREVVLDALSRECSRQQREGGSFGVILVDVDQFKSVNDTHGHLCGDEVLKEVSRRIAVGIRPYDTVGRYGGEEFLIVAPLSGELAILTLAERIRASVESPPISTEAGSVTITVSSGVTVSRGDNPLAPDALIHFADDALYRAKALGRNRSEMATQPERIMDTGEAKESTSRKS